MSTKTLAFLALSLASVGCATGPRAATFDSPEAAVRRLVEAANDQAAADELLGAGGFELLRSGDDVADREDLEAVVALVQERVAFEDAGEHRKIALLGNDGWELPIPLVEKSGRWHFDVKAGREEVLNRRIGRNELSTIATLRAIVDAQREYAREGYAGKPGTYAARLVSSPGIRDGLYWPEEQSKMQSPLGPLVADAFEEGYRKSESGPTPYHGYCYRLLIAQGKSAPGGIRNYHDAKGQLTGGFGVLAWPATYGNSGVMTFIVNQQGIVFQKDLGKSTESAAAGVKTYDPDTSWKPTGD